MENYNARIAHVTGSNFNHVCQMSRPAWEENTHRESWRWWNFKVENFVRRLDEQVERELLKNGMTMRTRSYTFKSNLYFAFDQVMLLLVVAKI